MSDRVMANGLRLAILKLLVVHARVGATVFATDNACSTTSTISEGQGTAPSYDY